MGREQIPELTQQRIKKAYERGEGSKKTLAKRFNVSESSVKRITSGITPAIASSKKTPTKPKTALVTAIAAAVSDPKSSVVIDGVDLREIMGDTVKLLSASMNDAPPTSREGVANALLRWMQFYRELYPPTMEEAVDRLLALPNFEPVEFVRILKERYAEQKAG